MAGIKNENISLQSLYKVLFVLTTAYLAISPLNIVLLNYAFRIPALFIIVTLIVRCYNFERKKCGLALFFLVAVMIIHFVIDTEWNFDIFLACFSVVAYLLLVIVSDTLFLDARTQKFINRISIYAGLVLILYYFSPISHTANAYGYTMQCPYLTYGLDNSNYAGIVTLLIFSMIFITMESAGKKTRKLCYLLEIVLLYFIYLTNTRSALAAALIIPFTGMIFSRIKMPNWLLLLFCSLPFLFVPFYIFLGNSGNVEGIELMGKDIMTGRDEVYLEFLDNIKDSYDWIMGNLQENRFKNAHNGPLAILVSVGIVGCLSYFYIFFSKLLRANTNAKSIQQKIAVFVILACFINTTGEAALLLGGFPGVTYLFTFFVFANNNNKNIQCQ